jgi:hypothetical protein
MNLNPLTIPQLAKKVYRSLMRLFSGFAGLYLGFVLLGLSGAITSVQRTRGHKYMQESITK